MQLRWEHIDERIVRRVHAHVAAAIPAAEEKATQPLVAAAQKTTTAESEHRTDERLEAVWSVFAASVAFFVVALYGTVCFHLTGPLLTLAILGLPLGTAVATWLPPHLAARTVQAATLVTTPALRGRIAAFQPDRLRQAFADAAQTRAESLYGEAIVLLSHPALDSNAAEPLRPLRKIARLKTRRPSAGSASSRGHTTRILLHECNALLSHSFRLEAEAKRISGLWENGQTAAHVEDERFALLRKMDNETDPIVKQSLLESVALLDERLQSIRAYPTLLARLDAHQEVVCQSLALVVSVLARSQAAPHALHAPDVRTLRAALRDVTHQTRAVEDAVLELTGNALS